MSDEQKNCGFFKVNASKRDRNYSDFIDIIGA